MLLLTSTTSRIFASRVAATARTRTWTGTCTGTSTLLMRQRLFHASPQAAAKLNVEGLAQKVKLEGQNVLVRADLNVPLDKVRGGCVVIICSVLVLYCIVLYCIGFFLMI